MILNKIYWNKDAVVVQNNFEGVHYFLFPSREELMDFKTPYDVGIWRVKKLKQTTK